MSSQIVDSVQRTKIRVVKKDGAVFDVLHVESHDGFDVRATSVRRCLSPSLKKPYVDQTENEEQPAPSPGTVVPPASACT